MRRDAMRRDAMRYHAMLCDTMQCDVIRCDRMRYDAIRCDTMRYDAHALNVRLYSVGMQAASASGLCAESAKVLVVRRGGTARHGHGVAHAVGTVGPRDPPERRRGWTESPTRLDGRSWLESCAAAIHEALRGFRSALRGFAGRFAGRCGALTGAPCAAALAGACGLAARRPPHTAGQGAPADGSGLPPRRGPRPACLRLQRCSIASHTGMNHCASAAGMRTQG